MHSRDEIKGGPDWQTGGTDGPGKHMISGRGLGGYVTLVSSGVFRKQSGSRGRTRSGRPVRRKRVSS